MTSRSAVDTIRGYCYQFDRSIISILSLEEDNSTVELEGIEDIDINNNDGITAIQCKYYEKTEYNHSVIAKPIRLMLQHFVSSPLSVKKYYLYGHYKAGQDKLILPFSIDFLKEKFLTHKDEGEKIKDHERLNLSDAKLEIFLSRLTIDHNAESFEEQKKTILNMLAEEFSCSEVEATHYYYNSAFNIVAQLSSSHCSRIISKSDFISKLDRSRILFNVWMCRYVSKRTYLRKIRNDMFTRCLNTEPYDRFFIIAASEAKSVEDVKECLKIIQKKWSQKSRRSNTPYSPFIHIHGLNPNDYLLLKEQVYTEGLIFKDGYNFFGSKFCAKSLLDAKNLTDVKFQLVETVEDLRRCVEFSNSTKEIYQFYHDESSIDLSDVRTSKNISVQIQEFTDIKELV